MNFKSLAALTLAASAVPLASAGIISYGICQTGKSPIKPGHWTSHLQSFVRRPGCNALAVSCYAAAGFTFGVTVVGGPPAILACNAALGTCMTACAVTALIAPIP
ncbi:hypothetical protein J3R83DRAFT_2516 [Lanmaoa asiatica]|nr:hypothetical protein J3R83DRAFT_2516 [Lanmaoa asiatica]